MRRKAVKRAPKVDPLMNLSDAQLVTEFFLALRLMRFIVKRIGIASAKTNRPRK